jgi:hypothetical protein
VTKNVRRFDVAVDDALAMGSGQGVGDLNPQRQNGCCIQRPALDKMMQRLAFQKFHRDEGLTIFLADVVNGANVGMI